MPNLSEEAKELLRKAVARAKEIPQGFDMNDWIFRKIDTPCGTAGCLAFEICVAGGREATTLNYFEVEDVAAKMIGVTTVCPLFYASDWPVPLLLAYKDAPPFSLGRALVLEQAVERWIAGDGSFNAPEREA